MALHESTFQHLCPTDAQHEAMTELGMAAATYAAAIEALVPDGADKTYVLRAHRSNAMWVNVALTRYTDGEPRL